MNQTAEPGIRRDALERLEKAIRRIRLCSSGKVRLRAYYALGRSLKNNVPTKGSFGKHIFKDVADQLSLSSFWLYKIRELAQRYTRDGFEEAIEAAPGLSLTHFLRLASVESPTVRCQLAKKAARGKWTVARLHREILRKLNARRKGGRRLKAENDVVSALESIQSDAELLNRRIRLTRLRLDGRQQGWNFKAKTWMSRIADSIAANLFDLRALLLQSNQQH